MNKARLDWVISGLNQYALTTSEDLFLKTVSADFDKNHALTVQQEERLETLYKEKSKLTPGNPNKKSDQLSFSKSSPQKTRVRIPRGKYLDLKK